MTANVQTSLIRRWARAADAFVAAPASARPLAVYRIGLAAVLLVQAFWMLGSLDDLFHPRGVVQWSVIEPYATPGTPRLSWFANAFAVLAIGPTLALRLTFLAYVGALACLLVGWRTRWVALAAWFIHVALRTSGAASIYGVDHFANISLFYFLFMPVGAALSLDRLAGRESGAPSPAARLSLRVLQLHLCLVYFSSGLEKGVGPSWWDGEVIFGALMRPDLAMFDFSWLARHDWIAMLIGWGTLLLEAGYPLLVWSRWTRRPFVLSVVAMHAGIALFMGLWSFSALMIVLNAAAFLIDATPAPLAAPAAPEPARAEPALAMA